MIKYKHHEAKKQLRENRRGKMDKKVDAKYLSSMEKGGSSGPKMSTEERRVHQQKNTEYLRIHMDEIKRLNNLERSKASLPLLTVTGVMAIDKKEVKQEEFTSTDKIKGNGYVIDLLQPHYG